MQENIGGVWLLWLCSTIQRERPVIQPQPDHIMVPANNQSHSFVRSLTQDNVSCGSTDGLARGRRLPPSPTPRAPSRMYAYEFGPVVRAWNKVNLRKKRSPGGGRFLDAFLDLLY